MKQLDVLTNQELGKLFPIIIVDSNPDWKNLFNIEKIELEEILGSRNILSIEHIGSTAVPNLPAKPIIDILIEVKNESNISEIKHLLNTLGYHFIPRPENPSPHMMFVKGYTIYGYQGQAYHIHIRYKGIWDEIYFRDYLIQNPEIAKKYADLKRTLSNEFKFDREGYTESKTEFINRITEVAKKSIK